MIMCNMLKSTCLLLMLIIAGPATAMNSGWAYGKAEEFDSFERSSKYYDDTELYNAVRSNDAARVLRLIKYEGVPLNLPNSCGWTPLHSAAINGRVDIIKLFLKLGLRCQIRNGAGKTPTDLAATPEIKRLIEYLPIKEGFCPR